MDYENYEINNFIQFQTSHMRKQICSYLNEALFNKNYQNTLKVFLFFLIKKECFFRNEYSKKPGKFLN